MVETVPSELVDPGDDISGRLLAAQVWYFCVRNWVYCPYGVLFLCCEQFIEYFVTFVFTMEYILR